MHWQLSCEELIILFLTTPFFFRESFRKHGVAGVVRSRLEQQTTWCATRELCWAADCEIMPAGLFVVAQHCNAIAAYTTRTTAVPDHRSACRLQGLAHFALFTGASRGWRNIGNARWRWCHVAPFGRFGRQQWALATARRLLRAVRSSRGCPGRRG